MENIETIYFTISLLLLIVSVSVSPLFSPEKTTIATFFCMVLISITTFLNTLSERKHSIRPIFIKIHIGIAVFLGLSILSTLYFASLFYIQYFVITFLILSVLISMLIVRITKPIKQYEHLENVNKIFAISFLVLVPLILIFHYVFEQTYQQFQIGFLLNLLFTALAISKIYDDVQRLSLVRKVVEPQKQQFKNYALTEREEEIALLLVKGNTYQSIAEQLFISLPTVKTHASNIYKKCKVKTRNELTYLLTN